MLINPQSLLTVIFAVMFLGMASSYEIVRKCPYHYEWKDNYCQYYDHYPG
ncbi:uncharacterized protein LOC113564274 [Drosophila erecta]|nr:uncharacterized protein LOC113564274 [Drosophila erecta]